MIALNKQQHHLLKMKKNGRYFNITLSDKGITTLLGNMIWLALKDLHTENVTIDQAPKRVKNKEYWLNDRNNQIEYNRGTAKAFFESDLFNYTGLDFKYINELYQKHECKYQKFSK